MRDERSELKELVFRTIKELAETFVQGEIKSFKTVAGNTETPFYLFIEKTLPYGYSFHAVNGDNCRTWIKDNIGDRGLFKLIGHKEETDFLNYVNERMNLLINIECQELSIAA